MSEQPEAPAPEKSGKLPEWASFTAAVTLITIFAFGTSSFYVAGLASSLSEPLAIYFSPTDYLRITTSWAIPPLGVAALVFLVLALFLPRFLHRWQNLHERFGVRFYLTLSLLATVLLVSFALIFLVMPHTKLRGVLFVVTGSLIGLFILTWGVAWVPASTAVKVLLVTVPFSMSFALLLGSAYEPYAIDEEPLSRVLFESNSNIALRVIAATACEAPCTRTPQNATEFSAVRAYNPEIYPKWKILSKRRFALWSSKILRTG